MDKDLLLSIFVCSNRPKELIELFDSYEINSQDHSCFEIIVNIDIDDDEMISLLEKQKKLRPFKLKYINKFYGGFYNSHKCYNDLIPLMNPNAYFALLLSDEMLVQTKDWDVKLKKYKNFFPDDIFRVKCSRFKLRNYQDPWECGFAPDNITFTTVRWLSIVGDWGSCFSSDAFQQYTSYYLFSSNPFNQTQYCRDIPDFSLEFVGDVAALNQDEELRYKRISGGIKSWFILNSYEQQKEMKKRAMLLKANILLHFYKLDNTSLIIDEDLSIVKVKIEDKKIYLPYNLNKINILFKNFYRKFNYLGFCGGGINKDEKRSFFFNVTYYLNYRYPVLKGINDYHNSLGYKHTFIQIGLKCLFFILKKMLNLAGYKIMRHLTKE